MTRRLAAAAALAAVLCAAPPVRADDVAPQGAPKRLAAPPPVSDLAAARARFRRGAELYAAKRYRDAIAEFEAAYRLKPHGAIHYNVAQCRERLGEWPGAIRGYHDYLREVPDATDREPVRASIRRLEAKLVPAGVQTLLVYSEPPGAEVRVDGHPRGRTPVHVVLPPGTYAIALELEGYGPAQEEVALRSDASSLVDLELRRVPGAPVVAAPGSPSGASPPKADLAPPPPRAVAAAPAAPPPPPPERRTWTWISAGLAGAALAAGAYYGYTAQQRSLELRDGTVRTTSAATDLRDDAVSRQRRANVLYGVAAAAGVAGATLFFVEGRF
jgi:hypothetical protein